MKTLFWIIGGVVCIGLIVTAMYIALTIGLSVYIARMNQIRGQQYQVGERQAEVQQMQNAIASLGNNMQPDYLENQKDADELAGKLPSLFSDPGGYKTEDNWLATSISREIAEMAFVAAKPDASLPDLKVKAEVDPDEPKVHVEIDGVGTDAIASDLTPAFAWDPNGYAPLAQLLLGKTPGMAAAPASDENDVLGHLLNLTGEKIAAEDVRISANLQAHPASWQDHEEAALILTAMAIREGDGMDGDNRAFLNRATAHLAIAQALRGNQTASWPGLIAGAAIRTLSGRELDALAHLDNLNAQPDLPEPVKPWIETLRMLAKQDWRAADVTEKSPLLLKIAWFKIIELDLSDKIAAKRLLDVVPAPPQDPNADPNAAPDATKQNPQALIPDWGRIAGLSPLSGLDAGDPKSADYRLDLEFHELDEILQKEGAGPLELDKLAAILSEPEKDTVYCDASGKPVVHVIGTGMFKADARRNLFAAMLTKDPDPNSINGTGQDPAAAKIAFTKLDGLFQGVPGYEIARLHLGFVDEKETTKDYADWLTAKKTWPIWELPFGLVEDMPGYARVKAFYKRAVPFGTAYQTSARYAFIQAIDPQMMPVYNTPELDKIKQMPLNDAIAASIAYNKRYNAKIAALAPQSPQPYELELQKLDPDNYLLATDHVPDDKLIVSAARFLDYNLNPIERIESLDEKHLEMVDRIAVMRKQVALDPEYSPVLSDMLREDGKDDEAAQVDRNDLGDITAPDDSPSMLMPLVYYDLDHGLYDEVNSIAKKEGLTTVNGQTIYLRMLERSGKLGAAETYAKQMAAQLKEDWPLEELYVRYRDHFPAQFAAEQKVIFPNGMQKASLASFTDKPQTASVISEGPNPLVTLSTPQWRMVRAGLQTNEVVVALNGYRVESGLQYRFVADLSDDPQMDFIVWRDPHYLEVKASVPMRRLNLACWSYKPPE